MSTKTEPDDGGEGEHDAPNAPVEPEPPRSLARPPREPLVPKGNPLRPRGLILFASGLVASLVLMASPRHLRAGVPLGALFVALSTAGLLDFFGTFDDPDERVAHATTPSRLRDPLLFTLGAGLLFVALLTLAVAGRLPPIAAAVAIPAAFLALAAAGTTLVAEITGTRDRPFWVRHGFWLVAAVTVLHLPALGLHSLTDPWETHYGEVAREILSRDDWISLWWAHEGWFWSKPVLDFWLQALAMATLGVAYKPGEMLASAAVGRDPAPEWAVRTPFFLFSLVAIALLYKAVARVFGKRAGLLAGLALATMPQWSMVAHQTMTDMPFVAAMTAAMALVLLGMNADPDALAPVYELGAGALGRLRVSAHHLVFGAIGATALAQAFYLLSRHLTLSLAPFVFDVHADSFTGGSAGNCGLPGSEACAQFVPAVRAGTPLLQAVAIVAVVLGVFALNSGERRVQRLYFAAAWYAAALATSAKGPAGLGIPVVCALAYVVVTGKWRALQRLEATTGLFVLACVALPWFFAMYFRHGSQFTDRLIFHDMFKRALEHVHDTNEGDDTSFRFYVWQLGYATFPWVGLLPGALAAWLRRRDDEGAKSDAGVFLGSWFLFGFALFSLMPTKFHHYILPVVPAAAALVGVFVAEAIEAAPRLALGSRVLGEGAPDGPAVRYERAMFSLAALAGGLLVLLVGRDFVAELEPNQARLLHLFTYQYKRAWPPTLDFKPVLTGLVLFAGAATLALVVARVRRLTPALLVAAAFAFTVFALDVYFPKTGPHWGQRETVLAYYRAAAKMPGPLVAYQMNWKGENFYTGNRLAIFVSTGKKFQDYLLAEKRNGTKVFYFVTEHSRAEALRTEIGGPRHFEKLTDPALNNKFVLVRARFE